MHLHTTINVQLAADGASWQVKTSLGQVKINVATANDSYCSSYARRLTNSLSFIQHDGAEAHQALETIHLLACYFADSSLI